MRVKASISKGFSIARSSLNVVLLLFVVGAVWSTLNAVYGPALENEQANPENVGLALALASAGLIYMLVQVYLQGGLMGYAQSAVKNGRATMGDFTAAGKKFFGKLLLLGLLIALIVIVLIAVASMFVIMLPEAIRIIAIIVAFFIATAAITFSLLICLAPYVIVCKNSETKSGFLKMLLLILFFWIFAIIYAVSFTFRKSPIGMIMADIYGALKESKDLLLKDFGIWRVIPVLLLTITVVAPIAYLLTYLLSSSFRESKFTKTNFMQFYTMLLVIVLIAILAGVILGGAAALISLTLPGVRAQTVVVGVLGSAVNAFIGVLVTGAFTNYYLEISRDAAK